VAISGKRLFLWRAVDSEGEVLDLLVQREAMAGGNCCGVKSFGNRRRFD
jgi:hypothetical protein